MAKRRSTRTRLRTPRFAISLLTVPLLLSAQGGTHPSAEGAGLGARTAASPEQGPLPVVGDSVIPRADEELIEARLTTQQSPVPTESAPASGEMQELSPESPTAGVAAAQPRQIAEASLAAAGEIGTGEAAGEVSVGAHGARPGDDADDTSSIRLAFAAAASSGSAVRFPAGIYRVTGTLTVPDRVRELRLDDGAVLRQYSNAKFGTLSKRGSVGPGRELSPAKRGARSVRLAPGTEVAVGSWLLLTSADSFSSQKPMKPGMLRRVVGVSGDEVALDLPLHRDLATTPVAYEVTMAAPVSVIGGAFEHANPLANFYSAISLHYVMEPVVRTEIRSHGAEGVNPNGTVGGVLDLVVHDLLDDHDGRRFGAGQHFGYGVSATGPTRGLRITGDCWAVRHCFTTNAAYVVVNGAIKGYGDPENIEVAVNARDTTSTALDTHEPGWNISFAGSVVTNPGRYRAAGSTSGKEGGGGVFVRARGTQIVDVTVTGAQDDAITIARPSVGMPPWSPGEGAVIDNVRLDGGLGVNGIGIYQPAVVGGGTHIRGLSQRVGVRLDATARGSKIDGLVIDLGNRIGGIGVLGSSNATISNVTYVGVTTQLVN